MLRLRLFACTNVRVLLLLAGGVLGCDGSSEETPDGRLQVTRVELALTSAGSSTPTMAVYDLLSGTVDTLRLFPGQAVDVAVTLLDASANPAEEPTRTIKQDPDRYQLIYTPTGNVERRIQANYSDREADYNLAQTGDNLPVGLSVVIYVSDDQAVAQGGLRLRLSRYEGEKAAGIPSLENDLDVTWPVEILFL